MSNILDGLFETCSETLRGSHVDHDRYVIEDSEFPGCK